MWRNQIFSLISADQEGIQKVRNIIVCDNYEIANQVAVSTYGNGAIAIDTTQYPLSVDYKFIDGSFYDLEDNIVERNQTETESIIQLKNENTAFMDRLSIAENALTEMLLS